MQRTGAIRVSVHDRHVCGSAKQRPPFLYISGNCMTDAAADGKRAEVQHIHRNIIRKVLTSSWSFSLKMTACARQLSNFLFYLIILSAVRLLHGECRCSNSRAHSQTYKRYTNWVRFTRNRQIIITWLSCSADANRFMDQHTHQCNSFQTTEIRKNG